MPKHLVIGNGSLLAAFDEHLQLRDLYFPHVGMEDHTAYGDVHRTGVWAEGGASAWLSAPSWKTSVRYKPETLVGHSRLRNDTLGIEIEAEDFVHPVWNILVRRFTVQATDGKAKEIRIFFNHDLHIYGDKQKDTAFYEPYTNTVIHYRQKRYFLVGGDTDRPVAARREALELRSSQSILRSTEVIRRCGIGSWSIGKAEYKGYEGTWRDAEDGVLSGSTIDQGSVDSTIGIHCKVTPGERTVVTQWLCCGTSLEEVIGLHQTVMEESPEQLELNCRNYWKSWVRKTDTDFGDLDPAIVDLTKRSLLIIRLHADRGGGILAAADADIIEFNRDTYAYVWPRDGAFVCAALDRAGYIEVTRRFFEFCCTVQTPDGYLLHKYNTDGSPGSSWHPWYRDGAPQLPIQEDETALVLWALKRHFDANRDFEFLQDMYERFLKKAARFLCDFRETETGLPLMSYDPWEEHRGVFTYTTACTIAGLTAAADISQIFGHYKHQEQYRNAADEMKGALLRHLFDEKEQRFIKKIKRENGVTFDRDLTPDMIIAAVWKLGVLPPDDPRVLSTMTQLEEKLRVRTTVGGLARFTNDSYHAKTPPSGEIPGNPWFITTLWDAEWHIALAQTIDDLAPVRDTLAWVEKHKSGDGILAEQIHPLTGAPLSVAPLTWSHAAYVETVLLYLGKRTEILKRNRFDAHLGELHERLNTLPTDPPTS